MKKHENKEVAEELKNNEANQENQTEPAAEVKTEEKEKVGIMKRIGTGTKKHWKKVLAGVGTVAAAVAGFYLLGKGKNSDVIDVPYKEITDAVAGEIPEKVMESAADVAEKVMEQ